MCYVHALVIVTIIDTNSTYYTPKYKFISLWLIEST